MTNENNIAALKSRIKQLQIAYLVLFGSSVIMIVLQRMDMGFGPGSTVVWAGLLLSAVCTRLYRTSLVNKYNEAMGNRVVS